MHAVVGSLRAVSIAGLLRLSRPLLFHDRPNGCWRDSLATLFNRKQNLLAFFGFELRQFPRGGFVVNTC